MQHKRLVRAQVEILYSQSAVTFLFPVVASIILAFALWSVANRAMLIGWLAVVWIYAIFRYGMLWKYTRSEITLDNASKWHDVFVAAVCLLVNVGVSLLVGVVICALLRKLKSAETA